MTRVHEGLSDPGFTVPDSVETAEICRKSGKLAIPGVCSHDPRGDAVYTEYFAKGTVPTEMCNTHVLATVCSVTGLLPGSNCPKTSIVRITLPADEEGETDDSKYAMPTARCSGHAISTTDPSYLGPDEAADNFKNSGSSKGSGTSAVPGLGPGGASTKPSSAVSNGPGRD